MAKKTQSAFMKPVTISATLAKIVGPGPMPRTEITKKLWDYIRKHGLQDKNNKRMINPDSTLSEVFGSAKAIDMFTMTSKVSKHIHA